MKVVCIDNENCHYLTVGKVYNYIINDKVHYSHYFKICDDNGDFNCLYNKYRFITLEECRKFKLDKLNTLNNLV
jgi:hypothetical protein